MTATALPSPVVTDSVFVVNGGGASVSVIDAVNDSVIGTIALHGVTYPSQVSLSPDLSTLAVAVPGFDTSGGRSGHGSHAASRAGFVVLLDAKTGSVLRSARTEAGNQNAVFAPAPRNEVWTSQGTSPGTTLVMDAATLTTSQVIRLETDPAETTFSTDGRYAFVANSASSTISVIDVAQHRVATSIAVGATPIGMWQGPGNLAYVANERSNTITVVDVSTLGVVSTFPLTFQPASVVFPNASEVWVTNPTGGTLEVRDALSGRAVRTIPVGKGAQAVAFTGDRSKAYVANTFDSSVSVIDCAAGLVVKTIPVGAEPNGLVWRPGAP